MVLESLNFIRKAAYPKKSSSGRNSVFGFFAVFDLIQMAGAMFSIRFRKEISSKNRVLFISLARYGIFD